jgi:hypothetical protein
MLVIAFGQGGPQVNRPNKGIDGQFEQLRDGAVQNVTGKYLNGHRRQHQNVNPAGQVNFEKIKYLFQDMFHDAVIRRNQINVIISWWERLPAANIESESHCHGSSRLEAAPTAL